MRILSNSQFRWSQPLMLSSSKRLQLAAGLFYSKLQATCIIQSSAQSWNSISPFCTNQSDCVKRAFFLSLSHSFADPGFPRCCVGKPLNTWFMWVAYSTGLLVASLRKKKKKKTEDWWNLELHMQHVYHSWLFVLRSKHLKVYFNCPNWVNVRKIDRNA